MSLQNPIFGVIGGGAWGTALAQLLAQCGHPVTLWARNGEVVSAVNDRHRNPAYLPDIPLSTQLRASAQAEDLRPCNILMLVIPAQQMRQVTRQLAGSLAADATLVLCAKGIEQKSHKFMQDVVGETLPGRHLAVLSGPTFADEVARGLPTAVTLACADLQLAKQLAGLIGQATFRPYVSDDVLGVELGGAVKNVMAIACGIVEGKQLGDNARAALMTRGLAEILRYGVACGARQETLMGLSGLGDLALTCNSDRSRNMRFGIALGEGVSVAEALAGSAGVVEGAATVSALVDDAARRGVDMPIALAIDGIVNHFADIDATVSGLFQRPIKLEAN